MYTKEQIQEVMWKLPKSLQMAIAMLNTGAIIKSIGEQFQLHVDQVGKLSDEIRDTLFNLHSYSDFKQNVINLLQVSPEVADQIVARVNNEIFLKIRELEKGEAEKERRHEAGDYSDLDEGDEEEEGEIAASDQLSAVSGPGQTTNIFEEKMGKMFDLKKTDTEIAEEKEIDPYREPIN